MGVIIFCLLAGNMRSVKPCQHIDGLVSVFINPDPETNVGITQCRIHRFVQLRYKRIIILQMVLVDQECIRIGTADETVVFTYHIHQDLGNFNQYLVAKRFAVQSVDQFKPVDIQGERIFFPCNVSVKLLAIPVEKVPGIQSRQRVFFRNFNKLAVFRHFDCVG